MSAVPTIDLNDGKTIPQLGFGVFQIRPWRDRRGGGRGAAGRLPPHRHRRDVRQRGGSRRGDSRVRARPREVYVTSKLNNGYHEPDDARRAFEGTLDGARLRPGRPLPIHWPLPTLYDGDYVSTWKVLEEFKAEGRARSIGVSNFQVAHLERLAAEATWSRRQPDRAAPVPAQRRGPLLRRGAPDRHPGLVADRPGRGPRRPGHHRDRRRGPPDPRPGGPALADRARQHRLPEVVTPERIKENLELFDFELSAGATRADRRPRPRRGGPYGPAS